MNIGRAIKRCRQLAGLTQRSLAAKAGITPTYLCLIEKERREPAPQLVRSLCDAMAVPPEILFWEAIDVPSDLQGEDKSICAAAKQIVAAYFEARVADDAEEEETDT